MPFRNFHLYLVFIAFFTLHASAQQKPASDNNQKRRSDLFSDKAQITQNDYLESIEKAGDIMSAAKSEAILKPRTIFIISELKQAAASLNLMVQNLENTRSTNVRNQQLYKKVLQDLDTEMEKYRAELDLRSDKLLQLRKDIRVIRKDSLLRGLIKDSVLAKDFKEDLLALRSKFKRTDSLIKSNLKVINDVKKQATENKMVAGESLDLVTERLSASGIEMFGNECHFIWHTHPVNETQNLSEYITEKFTVEKKAFGYYLKYALWETLTLIFFMMLLAWWIIYNLRYLKKAGKIENLPNFKFKYLHKNALLPVAVIGLTIGIGMNLYAPALYFEFLNLISLLVLTILFRNKWNALAFRNWLLLVLLFTLFCFIDLFTRVGLLQRLFFIVINLMCIRFGFVQLKSLKEEMYIKSFFSVANFVFISFNIMAILANVFGRVSLAHILSLSAVTALTQVIALSVFLKIILEIIVLQMYSIRIRRGIEKLFDYENLENNLKKPLLLLVTYLWVIVLASNLNLSNTLYTGINNVLYHKNTIGSFTFTIGGVLLFILIIWVAHLLQRYVGYFFGEIDDEANEESINKRQHSKLLITRLLLLIGGYLLAISASGMPLDKITIVLGALGVGVGLGLQSIVNNFVSGVILIFDRPIQIGDVIESGSESGRVKSIGLRTTKIDTANGAEVIIPNGNLLSQNITNWTFSNNYKLIDISFTITGETSQEKIMEIITTSLSTVPLVFIDKEPQLFFNSFSDGSYKVTVRFWCTVFRTEQALSEVRIALFNSFKKNDIILTN